MAGLPVIFAEQSYREDYQWVRNYTFVLNMPDLEHPAGHPGGRAV